MTSAPWTDTGRIQQDVTALQSSMRGKAEAYELNAVRSTVDRLEHSMREACATIDGLRQRVLELEQAKQFGGGQP